MSSLWYFLTSNPARIVFSVAFMLAAVPVLYYYYRRNPNPRFRPTFGEMSMVSLFALVLCVGAGFGLGGIFKPENDGKSLTAAPDEDAGYGVGGSDPVEGGGGEKGPNTIREKREAEFNELMDR